MNGNNMLTLASVGQGDVFIILLLHMLPVAIHTAIIPPSYPVFFVFNTVRKNE